MRASERAAPAAADGDPEEQAIYLVVKAAGRGLRVFKVPTESDEQSR